MSPRRRRETPPRWSRLGCSGRRPPVGACLVSRLTQARSCSFFLRRPELPLRRRCPRRSEGRRDRRRSLERQPRARHRRAALRAGESLSSFRHTAGTLQRHFAASGSAGNDVIRKRRVRASAARARLRLVGPQRAVDGDDHLLARHPPPRPANLPSPPAPAPPSPAQPLPMLAVLSPGACSELHPPSQARRLVRRPLGGPPVARPSQAAGPSATRPRAPCRRPSSGREECLPRPPPCSLPSARRGCGSWWRSRRLPRHVLDTS